MSSNDKIFYHTTLKGLVDHILQNGLKRYSIPNFSQESSDCIYFSNTPFARGSDYSTLEVDLNGLEDKMELTGSYVKVFADISPDRVKKVLNFEDTNGLCY